MPKRSKMEAQISDALANFEKEYMGRGPLETRTFIVDDMVIVRSRGVLTQAERQLIEAETAGRGRSLIKEFRIELLEKGRPLLEKVVEAITGNKVISLHTDMSTVSGERIIIFTLESALDFSGN